MDRAFQETDEEHPEKSMNDHKRRYHTQNGITARNDYITQITST